MEVVSQIASLIGAITVILGCLFGIYRWYLKQNKQDKDIKDLKEETCLLTYGLLACLDGLKQLGANGTVTDARDKLEKHINKKAHE